MPRINELCKTESLTSHPLQTAPKKEITGRTSTGFLVNVTPINRAIAALLLSLNIARAAAQDNPSPPILYATFNQWLDGLVGLACTMALLSVGLLLATTCCFGTNKKRVNRLEEHLIVVNRRLERLELEAVAARTAITTPIHQENPPAYSDIPRPEEAIVRVEVPPLISPDVQTVESHCINMDDRSSIASGNSYFEYEDIEATPM